MHYSKVVNCDLNAYTYYFIPEKWVSQWRSQEGGEFSKKESIGTQKNSEFERIRSFRYVKL
ncbi:MAG: hypothetical protein QM530_10760, partial [Phycisphaerales bacterium]|nr:hypothetical protein [Phycisphaerales bacterium]